MKQIWIGNYFKNIYLGKIIMKTQKILSLFFIFYSSAHTNLEPNIFLTSAPKSGTHLLIKCISLLTNQPVIQNFAYNRSWTHISTAAVQKSIETKSILLTHAIASDDNLEILKKNNHKCIFIFRDPRDRAVSYTFWVKKKPRSFGDLSKLPFDELLTYMIGHVADEYSSYLDWLKQSFVYTTTFEKLVGPRGGGTREAQITEIANIAKHLNLSISDERLSQIANNLFGGTGTMREGQIGSWKKHFTEEHKKTCKEVAGKLIIDSGYETNLDW